MNRKVILTGLIFSLIFNSLLFCLEKSFSFGNIPKKKVNPLKSISNLTKLNINPSIITTTNNYIYILDKTSKSIHQFSFNGKNTGLINISKDFSDFIPADITGNQNNEIVIVSEKNGELLIYSEQLKLLHHKKFPNILKKVHRIHSDHSGRLFIEDITQKKLYQFENYEPAGFLPEFLNVAVTHYTHITKFCDDPNSGEYTLVAFDNHGNFIEEFLILPPTISKTPKQISGFDNSHNLYLVISGKTKTRLIIKPFQSQKLITKSLPKIDLTNPENKLAVNSQDGSFLYFITANKQIELMSYDLKGENNE